MTQELLKPRVILENKYPDCPYEVGDILYEHEYANGNKYFALETGELCISAKEIKNFPYLFRPLKWWEKREVNEMPEYVKLNPKNTNSDKEGEIFKVTSAKIMDDGPAICHTYPPDEGPFECYVHCKYFLPASLEEYNNYLTSLP